MTLTYRKAINSALLHAFGRQLQVPGLEARRALTGHGELSMEEARFLGELVRESDPSRPIIEIGTLFGWSTKIICLFKQPQQTLLTVDNYSWNPLGLSAEDHFQITHEILAPLVKDENVIQVSSEKGNFYANYDGQPPALFFCDADHSYAATLEDLQWSRSAGASIICGDDYSPDAFPGVVKAVSEVGGAASVVDELFRLVDATQEQKENSR